MPKAEPIIRLDLNSPVFQEQLLTLQKVERHAALDTLNKIRQLTWNQLYRLALSSADQTQPQPRDAFKIGIATEHHSVLAQLQTTGRLQGIGGAEPMVG